MTASHLAALAPLAPAPTVTAIAAAIAVLASAIAIAIAAMIEPSVSPDVAALERHLRRRRGRREGREIRFLCPAHPDTRPSARWSPAKATWYCDVCQQGGGWRDLARRLGLDPSRTTLAPGLPTAPAIPAVIALPTAIPAAIPSGALPPPLPPRAPRAATSPPPTPTPTPPATSSTRFSASNPKPSPAGAPQPPAVGSGTSRLLKESSTACLLSAPPSPATSSSTSSKARRTPTPSPPSASPPPPSPAAPAEWRPAYTAALRGARVVVVPDHDDPGHRHAETVLAALRLHAADLRRLDLPNLPLKGDTSDWLAARRAEGLTLDQIRCHLLDLTLAAPNLLLSTPLALPPVPPSPGAAAADRSSLLPPDSPAAIPGATETPRLAPPPPPPSAATPPSAEPTSAAVASPAGVVATTTPFAVAAHRPADSAPPGNSAGARPSAETAESPTASLTPPGPSCGDCVFSRQLLASHPAVPPPRSPPPPAFLSPSAGALAEPAPPEPTPPPALHGARCLADVPPRPVDFLWAPYLPLGKLTLLDGDPGQGKSWLTAALAAAGSRGHALPGTGPCEPFSTLFLCEDEIDAILRPRLDALHADPAAIHARDTVNDGFLDLSTPADIAKLDDMVLAFRPRLLVIDPIQAFLGRTDFYRPNEVRAALAPLLRLAHRRRLALLVLRHITKARTARSLYAGQGSIDFAAAARSVLLAGATPDNPDLHALIHIKSNLTAPGPSLAYRLDPAFTWQGPTPLSADDLLAPAAPPEDLSAEDEARAFLRALLAGPDPLPARLVLAAARDAGVAPPTLRRAKTKERVRVLRRGFGPGSTWLWTLAAPATAGSTEDDPAADSNSSVGATAATRSTDQPALAAAANTHRCPTSPPPQTPKNLATYGPPWPPMGEPWPPMRHLGRLCSRSTPANPTGPRAPDPGASDPGALDPDAHDPDTRDPETDPLDSPASGARRSDASTAGGWPPPAFAPGAPDRSAPSHCPSDSAGPAAGANLQSLEPEAPGLCAPELDAIDPESCEPLDLLLAGPAEPAR